MMKQCTLNICYGLNDFRKHKLYTCNPELKALRPENINDESNEKSSDFISQQIGIRIKHSNP